MAEFTRPALQAKTAWQTIPHLESLSTGELIELAAQYELDIPPGLERVFIIEELLYLDHNAEDDADVNHHDVNHDEFKELAVLPRQYHISFIEALIRDPLWAFVFWEIKAHDREQYETAGDFGGYCLRVTPLDENSFQPNTQASFMVTVNADDQGRYLGFPPEDGRCFKVELCMHNGENCTVLAESPLLRLPLLLGSGPDKVIQAVYSNPLAQLSGVEHFSLIHSEDRPPRPRDIKG